MKVLIEAINTPQIWRFGGTTAELRIYADTTFETSLSQLIPAGRINDPNSWYLPIPCTVVGFVLLIPGFELDSTVDALVNPHARYTAVLVSESGRKVMHLANFPLNTLEPGDPSTTWGEILLFRDSPQPQQSEPSLLRQLAAMISQAAGMLTKSSDTNTGVTALSVAPLDPVFPIAIGANDPDWLNWLSGVGRVAAAGTAMLVQGAASVVAPMTTATSAITVTSLDPNVLGTFVVTRNPGVGFDILSSNAPGDDGDVSWILTEAS